MAICLNVANCSSGQNCNVGKLQLVGQGQGVLKSCTRNPQVVDGKLKRSMCAQFAASWGNAQLLLATAKIGVG